MLEVLKETDQRLIAVRISQELTPQDYTILRTLVNERIELCDGLRWYVEMADFEGWGPENLWTDFVLELHHADDKPLYQVAFIGDKNWEDWIARSCTWLNTIYPSRPGETKFFPIERRVEALRWVGAS